MKEQLICSESGKELHAVVSLRSGEGFKRSSLVYIQVISTINCIFSRHFLWSTTRYFVWPAWFGRHNHRAAPSMDRERGAFLTCAMMVFMVWYYYSRSVVFQNYKRLCFTFSETISDLWLYVSLLWSYTDMYVPGEEIFRRYIAVFEFYSYSNAL